MLHKMFHGKQKETVRSEMSNIQIVTPTAEEAVCQVTSQWKIKFTL